MYMYLSKEFLGFGLAVVFFFIVEVGLTAKLQQNISKIPIQGFWDARANDLNVINVRYIDQLLCSW